MGIIESNKQKIIKRETNWETVKNMTDKEIEDGVRMDEDAAPILSQEELSKFSMTKPRIRKHPVRHDRI